MCALLSQLNRFAGQLSFYHDLGFGLYESSPFPRLSKCSLPLSFQLKITPPPSGKIKPNIEYRGKEGEKGKYCEKSIFPKIYVEDCRFLFCMKTAGVATVFEKENRSGKDNYRPMRILPNLTKVFKRCLHKQFFPTSWRYFLKIQMRFLKGHSAQHCLIAPLETWKSNVDQGKVFVALMSDLLNAWYCLPHDLFLAQAYGFDIKSLGLVRDYFSNRKQRTKDGQEFSTWEEIKSGIPQGSILGPLFFNIHLRKLLLWVVLIWQISKMIIHYSCELKSLSLVK